MKIYCPHCRQGYEVENDELGQDVECQSCSKEFKIANATDSPSKAQAAADALGQQSGFGKQQRKVGVISLLAASVTLTILVAVLFLVLRGKWERDNTQTLLDMTNAFEDSARERKTEDALDKYRELNSFIGDHEIRNSDLKVRLSEAKKTELRLFVIQSTLAKLRNIEDQASTFAKNGELKRGIDKYAEALEYIAKNASDDPAFSIAISRIAAQKRTVVDQLAREETQILEKAREAERITKVNEQRQQQHSAIELAIRSAKAERRYDSAIAILDQAIILNPNASNLAEAQTLVKSLRDDLESLIKKQKAELEAASASARNPFSSKESLALYFLKKVTVPWKFKNDNTGGENSIEGTVRSSDAFVGVDRASIEFFVIISHNGNPGGKATFKLSFVRNFGTWEFDTYECNHDFTWDDDYVKYLLRGMGEK